MQKPKYKIPDVHSPEGNIYVIIGQVRSLLRQNGYASLADEMMHRITKGEAKSYEEALRIVGEYVEVS